MSKQLEPHDEIFEWICKIIDSASHGFHFDSINRIIELYFERNGDQEKKLELLLLMQKKWNEIHFIIT